MVSNSIIAFPLITFGLLTLQTIDPLDHWSLWPNRIGGVMVSELDSSVIDRGFEPHSGHTKDYKFGICCFSSKHTALRSKSKDWLARNQDNVSIRRLLFQWVSTIKNPKRTSSSSHRKLTYSCHDIAEKLLNCH